MIFNYSGLNNLTSGNVGFIQHWFIKSGILPGTASMINDNQPYVSRVWGKLSIDAHDYAILEHIYEADNIRLKLFISLCYLI